MAKSLTAPQVMVKEVKNLAVMNRYTRHHHVGFVHQIHFSSYQGALIPPSNQVAHMEWDADFLLIVEKEVCM